MVTFNSGRPMFTSYRETFKVLKTILYTSGVLDRAHNSGGRVEE